MTVHVISLDADGCIYNKTFYDLIREGTLPEDALIQANQDLFDKLVEDINEDYAYTKTTNSAAKIKLDLMVASLRQDPDEDDKAHQRNSAKHHPIGSFFVALPRIRDYFWEKLQPQEYADYQQKKTDNKQTNKADIQALKKAAPVGIDKYLLADIAGKGRNGPQGYRDGQAFKIGKNQAMGKENTDSYPPSAGYPDYKKLKLVYAQMHRAAVLNPLENIIYDFVDDEPLIDELHNFFTDHPVLIPHNVTLRLHRYDGSHDEYNKVIIENKNAICGTGEIDENYENSVSFMGQTGVRLDVPEFLEYRTKHEPQVLIKLLQTSTDQLSLLLPVSVQDKLDDLKTVLSNRLEKANQKYPDATSKKGIKEREEISLMATETLNFIEGIEALKNCDEDDDEVACNQLLSQYRNKVLKLSAPQEMVAAFIGFISALVGAMVGCLTLNPIAAGGMGLASGAIGYFAACKVINRYGFFDSPTRKAARELANAVESLIHEEEQDKNNTQLIYFDLNENNRTSSLLSPSIP